jgi:outer membrane cobalamin receptor
MLSKDKIRNTAIKVFSITAILLSSFTSFSQSRISGQVKDQKGQPLSFANVYIENTIDGTSTDSLGRFSFKTSAKGKQLLVVSSIGYFTTKDTVVINSRNITHNMTVKDNTVAMNEVVVTAGAFEANDDRKVAILKPLDIYTNAGAGGDIMGAIRTLPGTQAQSDQTGLFVRGGDASESIVIIDGMTVQNPFYSNSPGVSQRSRFTPFQFKGISFSSGGYSARYGQALSSVLELNTFDLPENSNANVSVGLTGAELSGTKKWNSSALELTGHYDNIQPFIKLAKSNLDFYEYPQGEGFSAKYTVQGANKDLLKVFARYENSSSGSYPPDPDHPGTFFPFGMKNNNGYFNSSYSHLYGKSLFRTAVSFSNNSDKIDWDTIPMSNDDWRIQWRGEELYSFSDKMNLLTGFEIQRYQYKQGVDVFSSQFNETIYAGYLETEWKPSKKLAIKPGVRFEHSKLLNTNNIAPRLAMAIGTGSFSQVSLAGGLYVQNADKKFLLAGYKPGLQKAIHYIANYQWVEDDRTFRIEGYYKTYSQLVHEIFDEPVKYNPSQWRPVYGEKINNEGSGYAAGIDIFWRDKASINNFDYWICYSFIDTKRLYENYKSKVTPSFVSKNNLNVLAKYFIESIQINLGLSYSYASGRSFYRPDFNTRDWSPDFHNFAFNLSYLLTVGRYFAVAYASVDNIFGKRHIYGYTYSTDGTVHFPVRPAFDRYVYLGFTISMTRFKKEEL